VTDTETLERIRGLVVPPAWHDVWICPHPNGHIQAVGIDSRGRRQYRYHDAWREMRDREKFDHMLVFAAELPRLRRHCRRALSGETDLSRRRVLAAAVRLLDIGFFRIGTEDYVEENHTYGLATLEKRHVRVDGDEIRFDYDAKSGKRRLQYVVDPAVAEVVRRLRARRGGGTRLLAAKEGGRWVELGSSDINAHIRKVTGGDFTAKEFRTWSGTVLAAASLAAAGDAASPTARKRAVSRAMGQVAEYLGNTPAVVRKSYVDPRVVDLYLDGVTIAESLGTRAGGGDGPAAIHGAVEEAVLVLLSEDDAAERAAA
jgi:DNA topoisomerase IB